MATRALEKYAGLGGEGAGSFQRGESRDIRALLLDVTISLPRA